MLNSFPLQHGATLYTIQLGLNLIWMPLFFGFQRPKEAVADIVALVGTTSYLVYVWSKVDTVASWLMVPYLGWLSFATYLTASHDSHHIYNQNQLTCWSPRSGAVFSTTGICPRSRWSQRRSSVRKILPNWEFVSWQCNHISL